VGTLNRTGKLRRPGRQDKEADTQLLAGSFKLGHALTAPIPLEGLDRKGQPLKKLAKKILGVFGLSRRGSPNHVPAADGLLGGKMLEHDPGWKFDLQGVQLDKVAGRLGLVSFGLPPGMGPFAASSPGFYRVPGRLFQPASALKGGENPADGGGRDRKPVLLSKDGTLGLAPTGILLPKALSGQEKRKGPPGFSEALGPAAFLCQALGAVGLKPVLPAVGG